MHFNTVLATTLAAFVGTGISLPMSGPVHSTTITSFPDRATAKSGNNVDANVTQYQHDNHAQQDFEHKHKHKQQVNKANAATNDAASNMNANANTNTHSDSQNTPNTNRKASGPARFNTHAQLNNTSKDRTARPSGSLVLSADDRKLICRAMCAMDAELCIMATLQDGGVW